MLRKSRKDTQLLAYFAGLVDGEGSVGAYWRNTTYSLALSVNNQFFYPLGLIHKEFPGGRLYLGHRDVWQLRYGHYNAQPLLEAILPYTIIKHEQIKVGIAFLNHRRRDHRGQQRSRSAECGRCCRYSEKLKALKHCQGMNSVNPMREYRAKPEDVEADAHYVRSLLEGVETSAEPSTGNKANSVPEKEIVQAV